MLTRQPERQPVCLTEPSHGAASVGAAALGALLLAAMPGLARANPYSVHVEGVVAAAWTDNTNNRPEVVEDPGQTLPEAGFFTQLRPSVLFTYESRRSVHVSAANLDINLYETEEPGNSYNGALVHNSLLALSPLTELGLGASLGFGRVDPLNAALAGQAGQIQGDTTFVSLGVNQSARRQLDADLRLDQGFSFNHVDTDQPGGESAADSLGASLGVDRSWARTALGLVTNVSYVGIDQNGNDSTQLIANVSANVRRDLDLDWSVSAAAGLGFIYVVEQPDPPNEDSFAPTPTGSVTVNYLRPVGPVTAAISATVGHAITPNLLLGNVTNTSSGTLSGAIPLPWLRRGQEPTVVLSSSAGAAHSRPALSGGDQPTWNSYNANGAVSWSVQDGIAVSLRYQYARIDVSDYDPAMEIAGNIQPPVEFFRHTVLLEVGGRFPTREAAQLPERIPRRVDRSNERPIGGEDNERARGGRRGQ